MGRKALFSSQISWLNSISVLSKDNLFVLCHLTKTTKLIWLHMLQKTAELFWSSQTITLYITHREYPSYISQSPFTHLPSEGLLRADEEG